MKKIIILLGIVIAFPLSAQSMFGSFATSSYDDKKVESYVTETVYEDVELNKHEVRIAVVKKTEDSRVSYDIRFSGEENTTHYVGGSLTINDFDIMEINGYYYITLFYSDRSPSYQIKDKEGDYYQVYDSNNYKTRLNIKVYGKRD